MKLLKIKGLFIIGFLATCFVTGCTVNNDECLSPLYDSFSYPMSGYEDDALIPGESLIKLPQSPWKIEADLPIIEGVDYLEITMSDGNQSLEELVNIIQTREVNNHHEIWVVIPGKGNPENYLAMYRTDTKNWQIFPETINKLIIDENNTIWGYHQGIGNSSDPIDGRILSVFNEQDNKFKAVVELQDLTPGVERDGNFYYNSVLLDDTGDFWLIIQNNGIYSFIPSTGQIIRRQDFPHIFRDAQTSPDGSIFLLVSNFEYDSGIIKHEYLLAQVLSESNEIRYHDLNYILEPYPRARNIIVDHLGRVWLDNVAYLDGDGSWQQIQRNPVFISHRREAYNDYKYKSAQVLLESSDGRIWFLHRNNGMIYLDPQDGNWCWFTTYKSNIAEDSSHNLWMVADGKLYTNPLDN